MENPPVILVVDDDDDLHSVAAATVRRLRPDAVVRHYRSPAAAITDLADGDADLVVTDLLFEGSINGLDLLRVARAHGVPCLLCSDVPDQLDRQAVRPKADVIAGMPATIRIALAHAH